MSNKIGKDKGAAMAAMQRVPLTMVAAIFLVSLSILLLEITFTRILSVMLSYHYVFIVISIALLGLGIGGVISYFARFKITVEHLPVLCGIFAISIFSAVFIIAKIGSAGILFDSLIILLPFIFGGIILSKAFQEYTGQSGKIYAADLTGAAAGALLAVPLLNRLSAVNVGILVGVFAAVAGLSLIAKVKTKVWFPALSSFLAITFFLITLFIPATGIIILKPGTQKELLAGQVGGPVNSQIIATRWSSFGRTDLVTYNNTPDLMWIFTDATAGTSMWRFSGDVNNPGFAGSKLQLTFSGGFPLRYLKPEQKDNALIIGAGGGRDVLAALMSRIKNITAVEVNPDTVELVKEYSVYNGGIYTDFSNVKVVVAEGRSYLRQQKEKYDVIMLSIPVTKTSRSPEGFALTENFLFTSDSIADYYDHLTDNGRLVIVAHNPAETMRLMSLTHAALESKGFSAAETMEQVYTFSSHHEGIFVLSKNKIDPQESYAEHQILHLHNMDPHYSYLPYIDTDAGTDHIQQSQYDRCQMLNPALVDMSRGNLSRSELVNGLAMQGIDISTVTDERPFFYSSQTGVPGTLASALALSVIFLLGIIFLPGLMSVMKPHTPHKQTKRTIKSGVSVAVFTLLGVGFMLAEVPLIQRFTLFLGEPVLSVSVLLFSLLIGAGMGGLTSSHLSSINLSKKTGFIVLAIAGMLLIYALVTPILLKHFLGLSLSERALYSMALLLPLGFVLGFPFPLSIRLLREIGAENHVPWMWGINGGASVFGSVLAVILAMKTGFAWAMIAGAACYALMWLILHWHLFFHSIGRVLKYYEVNKN